MKTNFRELSAESLAKKEARASKRILPEDVKLFAGQAGKPVDVGALDAKVESPPVLFVFPELFAGDCMMQYGATLVFNANGTGTFTARVRSTDDDDEWKMHFVVNNPAGAPIIYLPTRIPIFGNWIHPFWVIELPQPEHGYYDWRVDFAYDASLYSQIATVTYEYSC